MIGAPVRRRDPQHRSDGQHHGRTLSLAHVYALATIAVTVGAAWCTVIGPADYWWHLANGRTIVERGVMPTVDSFTFTQAGEPFFNQMWLAQAWMYVLHRAGGPQAALLAHGLVIGLAYAALLWFCIKLTGRPRLCSAVVLSAVLPLSFVNWAVRPQPYAFPLFVVFVILLLAASGVGDRVKPPGRWLWLLPVAMAVWVNVHGSFALGVVMVSLTAAVEAVRARTGARSAVSVERRRLYLVAAATWAATLINPRGYEVWSYVVRLLANDSVKQVIEWQPVELASSAGVFFFGLAAAVLALMMLGRRRPGAVEVLLVVPFLFLGAIAIRNTLWFALLVTPILCLQLATQLHEPDPDSGIGWMNWLVAGVVVVGVIAVNPWLRPHWAGPELATLVKDEPAGAVAYLASAPQRPQRLFNDMGYGSYLPWALPSQKTFIDPRFELFPLDQVEDYGRLIEGRELERLTEKYDFDGFLLDREVEADLATALERAGWAATYTDGESVLFEPSR